MDKQESNELRARAEALLSSGRFDAPDIQGDVEELVQELSIYMAELEAQNEELNQAYVCIEEQSRDNFALFEHAPIAYCVLSEDHRVLKLNKRCRELFIDKGTSQNQFLPIVYKTTQQSSDIYSWLFDDRQPTLTVHYSKEPNEWHLLEKKPYHSNQKLIAITDITAQINTQQKLQEKSLQAQLANDTKAQFLANMSHEIRTPLTGIMGFINLMEDEHLADTAQDKLERIKESANSLLRILDDVIDISKLNADKLSIDMSDFDLHQLIHDTTALYDHKRKTDDVSYDIVIDDGVPQFIHSDADKIKQILSNLISNASKFTESGKIGIKASLLPADEQLKIMVEDTGIGINANGIDELFEAFVQDESSLHRKYHGTGLGLAISKKLTNALQGTLDARSREGGGSMFWFSLPLHPASGPVIDEQAEKPHPDSIKPLTILVADDNRTNQIIIKAMLEKLGHYVDLVDNGQDAVDAYHDKDYDLIIMDSHMPVMTGYQATQIIRSSIKDQPKPITILSWTADVRHQHVNHVLNIGMNGLLSKPINRDELERVITQIAISPSNPKL